MKIAVILAGCGILDGSEIHESVCSLLALSQHNCEYQCFSFDKEQKIVCDHKTKENLNEKRNMMAEAGRIARLHINDIKELNVNEFDGLWIPGGRGTGYNLCSYFIDGEDCTIDTDLEKVIKEFYLQKKPICALCLAPIVLNKVLKNIKITVGNDKTFAELINKNNFHIETKSGDICIDKENKIFSSPCYMLTKNISVIYTETTKIIEAILNL